ncbi:hypothetical protein [Massilia sp. MP_M2]|uniref:hypothetical protein n=1 Tax=Massilia sp. MP_M2 TaxID=3071713 RepID=UPI00319E64F0
MHGGPGNPTSVFGAGPFASCRKHITLAQWDQRGSGIVRRAVRKYEAPNIDPTPPSRFEVLPSCASPQAKAGYTGGEDYSFLKFVGWKGDGMASTMDLYRLVMRRFFEAITAPEKAL